jgi:hypothetical protein
MDTMSSHNRPEVVAQWLKRGTVPASYVKSVLGDQSLAVSITNPEGKSRGTVVVQGTAVRPVAVEQSCKGPPKK